MRKLIIDRFDGKYAICEGIDAEGEVRKYAIPNNEVPKEAKEGCCLVIDDEGVITVDNEETQKLRAEIAEKEKKLSKK